MSLLRISTTVLLTILLSLCGCRNPETTAENPAISKDASPGGQKQPFADSISTAAVTETFLAVYSGMAEVETFSEPSVEKTEEAKENLPAAKDNLPLMDCFQPICQTPELPTGCEITSLTMVLRFYGFDADKEDLSDNYLQKGEVGTVDFHKKFEGDPRDEYSFGCYAPVIADTADLYLAEQGSSLRAELLNAPDPEDLFPYIDRQIPVIVWGTANCAPGKETVTWEVDGKELTWISPEHCMVMVGYDRKYIYVADPLFGDIRGYTLKSFEYAYHLLGSQAIILN